MIRFRGVLFSQLNGVQVTSYTSAFSNYIELEKWCTSVMEGNYGPEYTSYHTEQMNPQQGQTEWVMYV